MPRTHSASLFRGFTLTEVLVVLAVITLLLGILLPALAGIRGAGKAHQCMGHLSSIGQAVTAYQATFNDYYPLSSHTAGSLVDPAAWLKSLEPFGIRRECRHCPADPHADARLTSYATNDHFEALVAGIDYDAITGDPLPGGRRRAYQRSSDIHVPSKTVYVAEPRGEGTIDHLHSVGWTTYQDIEEWIDVERHGDGAQYLFADCHVSLVQWSRLKSSFSTQNNMFNPEVAH